MLKYEPNFFVPCDDLRNISLNPVLCEGEPLKAGALAMNFLNGFLSPEQKDAMILDENKARILPGKLQEKVMIVTVKSGTLILKTNSSVWRAEIMAIKNNIIADCNRILGKIVVKSVKI
jgi:membrane-associated HD superfamily phosphohydrolase